MVRCGKALFLLLLLISISAHAQTIPQAPTFTPLNPGHSHNEPLHPVPFLRQESLQSRVARLLPPQPRPGDPHFGHSLPTNPQTEAEKKRLKEHNDRSLGRQKLPPKPTHEVYQVIDEWGYESIPTEICDKWLRSLS